MDEISRRYTVPMLSGFMERSSRKSATSFKGRISYATRKNSCPSSGRLQRLLVVFFIFLGVVDAGVAGVTTNGYRVFSEKWSSTQIELYFP